MFKYINYYLTSVNAHGIHSPFVYSFAQNLLYDRTPFYQFEVLEKLRTELRVDFREINRTELGAGSRTGDNGVQSVSHIARNQLAGVQYAQLLFKMVNHFKPKTILELGTSLGLSTAYLASASNSRVITLEGDPALVGLAQESFDKLELKNIDLVEGDFSLTLPGVLNQLDTTLGLVYIDGNHRYDSTMDYYRSILAHCDDESIIVLDDIRWSKGMEQAWTEIKEDDSVGISIDLFRMGIVFLKKDQRKQHFKIRF